MQTICVGVTDYICLYIVELICFFALDLLYTRYHYYILDIITLI